MWQIIIVEILKNVIVPELSEYIQNFFAENGRLPTREELQAKVDSRYDAIISGGNAFLNRPAPTNPQE